MAPKVKKIFTCTECGYECQRWMGQCPECRAWNTLTEEIKIEPSAKAFLYVNLLILPNALISSIIVINSCREATINCSGQWGGKEKSREQIGDYNYKIFRNIILLIVSGALEAVLFFTIGRVLTL